MNRGTNMFQERIFRSTGRRLCLLLVLFTSLVAVRTVSAQVYMTEAGRAEFTSSVPLHSFTGESEYLVGMINLADSTVDFYLDLTTLETGLGKRDKDMRITLNTDEYPFAEFFGKLVTPFENGQDEGQKAVVEGVFKIHGVSREVKIEGLLQNESGRIRLEAEWNLNLEDYQITPPRLLIVKVDKIQKIRIEALLHPVFN